MPSDRLSLEVFQHVRLGGDPTVDPELTGGIIYPIWLGNVGSPRRNWKSGIPCLACCHQDLISAQGSNNTLSVDLFSVYSNIWRVWKKRMLKHTEFDLPLCSQSYCRTCSDLLSADRTGLVNQYVQIQYSVFIWPDQSGKVKWARLLFGYGEGPWEQQQQQENSTYWGLCLCYCRATGREGGEVRWEGEMDGENAEGESGRRGGTV